MRNFRQPTAPRGAVLIQAKTNPNAAWCVKYISTKPRGFAAFDKLARETGEHPQGGSRQAGSQAEETR